MMTSRATIGEVAINAVPMATNQGFINVIGKEDKVCSEFLAYWIKQNRSLFEDRAYGATFKELSKSNFKTIAINLPPLAEQHAIAHVLRTVQQAREARQREIELERERKAALMQRLFTHGTRGEPRKQTEIGEMPESWQVYRLGAMSRISYGLTVNETRRNSTQRAPYLTVAHVTRGALRLKEVREIGMVKGDAESYRLRGGDVLLVEGNGNPELLGSAAVWNDELPFALHQNHLIRARPDRSVVLPKWMMSYLNSDAGRAQLLGKAKTSSGLSSINSSIVTNLQIPLPPLSEQQMIVEVFDVSDAKLSALEREVSLLDELFRALLEEVMTGRLSALPSVATIAEVG